MSFNYAKSAKTAASLIAKFGRAIQVKTIAEGTYSTATGGITNTVTLTSVKACDFAMKGNQYADGSLIQMGDRYALIDNSIATIDVSDKLIIDTIEWTIIGVEKLAPANVLVLHKVFIRK